MKDYKRKNGAGSVYRLSGRRSRPYVVVLTTKCIYDSKTGKYIQKRHPIGYYETKDEAIYALVTHQKNNTKEQETSITFSELYDQWKKIHFRTISDSMIRTWESAYNHFESIHGEIFKDLQPVALENCINSAQVHSSTKIRMKGLCNQLYKFAVKCGYISENKSNLLDPIRPDPPVYPHKTFTDNELSTLWSRRHTPYIDMILIACYTGLRPTEMLKLKHEEINFSSHELKCGSKTDAGRSRIIPLHPKILPLIEKRYLESKKTCQKQVFLDNNGNNLDYARYRYHFRKIMQELGTTHRPHDTRHTFISIAKEDGVDEYILKRIVGHVISDLTERVYTHRTTESLHKEINKIRIRV